MNYQAARGSQEIILTGSVFDALSFKQAGIGTAISIYGPDGFTTDHLDCIKREGVKRVVLALDSDEAGRKATDALKETLEAAGVAVRVASFPQGVRNANDLLVSRRGDATEAFRRLLDGARAAGIPARVSPHTLRHSFAAHLIQGGADVRHVQELLGHSSLSSTAIYTRVAVADLRGVTRMSHPRETTWTGRRKA